VTASQPSTLTADQDGETTELQMDHSVPAAFGGPSGALYVGPGWDGALLGLALYLEGKIEEGHDPREMANSPETLAFSAHSIRAWTKAVRDSGLVTEEELRPAVEAAVGQFTPGSPVEDFL
jgi:hypothetical protein